MIKLKKGETVMAKRTVRIEGTHAIVRNRNYMVHKPKQCCCHQAVDIGYRHHKPIVTTCASCGDRKSSSRKVLIPASYFLRKGEKIDRAQETLDRLEDIFRKAERT